MLLVSSHVPVITWLCSRAMRFQSRPTNWTLSPWNLRELSGYSIRLHHGGFKSPLGLRFFSDFLLHKRRITIPWFIDGERHYTQAPGWVWSRLTNLWSSLFIPELDSSLLQVLCLFSIVSSILELILSSKFKACVNNSSSHYPFSFFLSFVFIEFITKLFWVHSCSFVNSILIFQI